MSETDWLKLTTPITVVNMLKERDRRIEKLESENARLRDALETMMRVVPECPEKGDNCPWCRAQQALSPEAGK